MRARIISDGAPYVQDAVITGMNRDYVGAMIFPRVDACRELAGLGRDASAQDVLNSPMISDPLHRLDCCVITDGGGAIVMVKPEIAKRLKRPLVKVLGAGEAPKHQMGGKIDLTYSGAVW